MLWYSVWLLFQLKDIDWQWLVLLPNHFQILCCLINWDTFSCSSLDEETFESSLLQLREDGFRSAFDCQVSHLWTTGSSRKLTCCWQLQGLFQLCLPFDYLHWLGFPRQSLHHQSRLAAWISCLMNSLCFSFVAPHLRWDGEDFEWEMEFYLACDS